MFSFHAASPMPYTARQRARPQGRVVVRGRPVVRVLHGRTSHTEEVPGHHGRKGKCKPGRGDSRDRERVVKQQREKLESTGEEKVEKVTGTGGEGAAKSHACTLREV